MSKEASHFVKLRISKQNYEDLLGIPKLQVLESRNKLNEQQNFVLDIFDK